jgi:hypothetical protein
MNPDLGFNLFGTIILYLGLMADPTYSGVTSALQFTKEQNRSSTSTSLYNLSYIHHRLGHLLQPLAVWITSINTKML